MSSDVLTTIRWQCERQPQEAAITTSTTTWTYGMLGEHISGRAQQFAHRMRPGAVTAILMAAEPESVVHVLATAQSDRVPLLVPSGLPAWEERGALKDSGAAYLAARGMFLPLGEEAPPVQRFPAGLMQLTSGSLGPSRPAFRTWDGVSEEIATLVGALDLSARDTVMVTSAPAHSYAFMAGILAPLSVGAHIVLAPTGSLDLEQVNPTIVLGLPAAYAAWATQYGHQALRSVRFAFSAGAPLPEGLYDTMLAGFDLPIRQDYGTTETGTIALDTGPNPDPFSVGSILPHIECRFATGPDREGEIEVRGSAVARGYVTEGNLVPCTDAEGWYRTLDTGGLTADNRLRLTGRKRLPLQVGARRVDPRTLEIAALGVPGVDEAVAVQVAGSGIKVVVTGEARQEDLDRWAGEQSRDLGAPVQVERRPDLPRSPAGKLLRKYLV